MRNFFEIIKEGLHFNKFEVGDLVVVEYSCPLEDEHLGLFSQSDYLVHVLSGKKTWKTINGVWVLEAGDTLYLKKGAAIINQYFEEEFCLLGFFIPDYLIQECLADVVGKIPIQHNEEAFQFTAAALQSNHYLDGYFQSMLNYFRGKEKPLDEILKIKLKELLINVICSDENPVLAAYLKSIALAGEFSLPLIMETNYCYNLSLEEFAKLTHRSLSTFKRDFQNYYNMPPGRWLLGKRLERSAQFLLGESANVTQIAFDCGFEDVSHFSRAFKQRFGCPPSEFRKVSA
ncbi:MAG: helix-turn-helix transcriptional regulator [Lewinellaceae bacterium]|nr:helix-turn-helix transcriptional regulator [Saprospiraceae bacterium]MCB9338932.1 helix-turn-helix transcriptional regulator [Lewinellaceae bacterium]